MNANDDPLVIVSENQPHHDVGRIVGEAVSRTIQELSEQNVQNGQARAQTGRQRPSRSRYFTFKAKKKVKMKK